MGLAWQSQHAKLKNHHMLSTCVTIIVTQMPGDDQSREHIFIPLRWLPSWLTTVNPKKVAPELKDKIEAYQRECAAVLYDHFAGKALVVAEPRDLDAELTRHGGVTKAVMHDAWWR